MIHFTLSEEEKKMAIEEGVRRQKANEAKSLKGRNGGPESGKKALRVHILGAAGEMAMASFLNLKQYIFLNHLSIYINVVTSLCKKINQIK